MIQSLLQKFPRTIRYVTCLSFIPIFGTFTVALVTIVLQALCVFTGIAEKAAPFPMVAGTIVGVVATIASCFVMYDLATETK
jgi:hypothetical protein